MKLKLFVLTCRHGRLRSPSSPSLSDMFAPNPFSPGKRLTQPELFSGRKKQLGAAVQTLVQAASGNARHALITGERGIGKSSFSSQLQGIARGEQRYLDLVDATSADLPYTLLAVEHIAQTGQGPNEIAAGLLRELNASKGLARFAKFNFDFSIDLGPFSTSVRQKDEDPQDAVTKFIDGVQQVVDHVKNKVDGIVLVIDEVDRVAGTAGVSTFFKVATERLSSRGIENVSFLLVGLLGSLDALRVEHPSVGRVFRPLEVPLMIEEEGRDVVNRALKGTAVTIEDDAATELFNFSGGYPNAVHLIGEAAYDLAVANGDVITADLVREAVDEVVQGAAREDYDPIYLRVKGRSRSILRFIANQDEVDVQSAEIIQHLKVKPTDISNNFDTLLRADILVRPAAGVYRLREPLFREYLRYLEAGGEDPVQRRPEKRGR